MPRRRAPNSRQLRGERRHIARRSTAMISRAMRFSTSFRSRARCSDSRAGLRAQRADALAMFEYGELPAAFEAYTR